MPKPRIRVTSDGGGIRLHLPVEVLRTTDLWLPRAEAQELKGGLCRVLERSRESARRRREARR